MDGPLPYSKSNLLVYILVLAEGHGRVVCAHEKSYICPKMSIWMNYYFIPKNTNLDALAFCFQDCSDQL